jgi:hypothetical protein
MVRLKKKEFARQEKLLVCSIQRYEAKTFYGKDGN